MVFVRYDIFGWEIDGCIELMFDVRFLLCIEIYEYFVFNWVCMIFVIISVYVIYFSGINIKFC